MWNSFNPRDETVRFDPHGGSVNEWQQYVVPKGARLLQMVTQGPGGNGGSGFGAAAATARGGGGGGGVGATSRLLIPAEFLPEILFVQPGIAGAAANNSRINVRPVNAFGVETVLYAGPGSAGGNGSATAAGAAAGSAAIATIGNTLFQCYGLWTALAGAGSIAGGAHTGAVGGNVTYGNGGILLSGGAGGAGCTVAEFAGGILAGAGMFEGLPGGVAGGGNGHNGLIGFRPLFTSGGTGGGSSNTIVGGKGGDGGPGSGGGGGGAGVTTGGAGGKGGNGFIYITAIF